ncbi:D-alanyl-D-alanine carboxypeptidase family protein [Pseudostreptobacillus hongkongensis]|uniref:D-alanyl-D-alanine carboxypeptidase family protein n=1 Tax=Pseudostreptobacillus hongkongensis TaxID=1162717 RepID=UPI00083019A4|nr:serine hydrolase [Pseudostreptobacillus hongkongensis]
MKKLFFIIFFPILSFSFTSKEINLLNNKMFELKKDDFKYYESMYVGDENNNVYYQYDATEVRPLASVTKLMTALVVFDDINSGKYSLNTKITVSQEASKVPYGFIIKTGESYTIEELLKLLLINSSNSAAYQLALNSTGNVDTFVNKMNQKAKKLKLRSLRYYTPHGLPPSDSNRKMDIGNARDIYKLALVALKNKELLRICNNESVNINGNKIKSTNSLIGKYAEVQGLKTGYHSKALYNIVYYMNFGNQKVVQVILGSRTTNFREKIGIETINIMRGIN